MLECRIILYTDQFVLHQFDNILFDLPIVRLYPLLHCIIAVLVFLIGSRRKIVEYTAFCKPRLLQPVLRSIRYMVFFQLLIQGSPADIEQPGRLGAAAIHLFECLEK